MSLEINIPSTKFIYAFSKVSQLNEWLKENPDIRGVCFAGRSNVGKSSLINALFGKKTARTSKTPGRTQAINIFEFNLSHKGQIDPELPKFYLFDFPGYGYAKVSKEMSRNWDVLFQSFFQNASQNLKIINIQDARNPLQQSDKQFSDFCKHYPFESFLVFNKMDKLKRQKDRAQLKKLRDQILDENKHMSGIFYLSAETLKGVKELHDYMVARILD
jgi:GTP-binding protein